VHTARPGLILAFVTLALIQSLTARGAGLALSENCPPGFELSDGQCKLRSLYQMYPSLQDAGVGGLKAGLPAYRDGFTPQQIDLARYLFFDPVLSGDGTLSCASCHNPDLGFAGGRGRSLGAGSSHVVFGSQPVEYGFPLALFLGRSRRQSRRTDAGAPLR
jgi:cytochrome c peroxidase